MTEHDKTPMYDVVKALKEMNQIATKNLEEIRKLNKNLEEINKDLEAMIP